ncbi:MAG: DEAD/DEAH box helicase, partial [Blastocatellia bacterium]
MIILHAGFLDHQLWLWGEASAEATADSNARRGRKPAARSNSRKAQTLPFDAGSEGLLAALGEVTSGLKMSASDVEKATVWTPTVDEQPAASSALIAEPPSSTAKAAIAPWMVSAISLSTAEAVGLLCLCVERETLAQGVIAGRDLAFWAAAMRLGGAMVAREQFLPSLEPVEDFYRARWEPVFAGADAQRFRQLAKTMPHACRALTPPEIESLPDASSLSVLESFIGEVVDYLARSGSAVSSRKASSFESVHDYWLHALRSADGVMEGAAKEMAALTDQLREWRRPISVSAAAPFRLCFRLEEPEEETE